MLGTLRHRAHVVWGQFISIGFWFLYFSAFHYAAGMTQLLHPDVTTVKLADAAIFGKISKCAEAVFNVFVLIRGKRSEDVNN